MAERPVRRTPKATEAHVVRSERLSPHMQRIVLGGPGLADFGLRGCTDHYIKLLFVPEGVSYPEPFDLARIREELPREQWPVTRTYTVRSWDAGARELTVDFVVHGDEGLAGPWALRARPGETVRFLGPGGDYVPSPDADWHLLAGDESALPAIAAALEQIPADAEVRAFVEVGGPEDELKSADDRIVWLHRGTRPVGEALVAAVRGVGSPAGEVHAFVHGEAGFVKELRRLLRVDLGVPRERLSVSGYWRLGHNEDGWQASKPAWNAQVEAEQEAPPAGDPPSGSAAA